MKKINQVRFPKQDKAHQKIWLFDLDNTLHHASLHLFPLMNEKMIRYIREKCDLNHQQSDVLRKAYTRHYGAAVIGLRKHHQIDASDFLNHVHDLPDLPNLLQTERGIRQIIAQLPGRKYILTNGAQTYVNRVLEHLHLKTLFDDVLAIEQMRDRQEWRAKPDLKLMRKLIRLLNVAPARIVLVEDTRTHLQAYKKLGIRTVWMTGFLNGYGFGRKHYIDQRIGRLRHLRKGLFTA